VTSVRMVGDTSGRCASPLSCDRCTRPYHSRMTFLLYLLLVLTSARTLLAQDSADVVIRGGVVVDGTGTPARQVDVAIRGDRIVFIGDTRTWRAARTIAATGYTVTPGFIDPHTHTYGELLMGRPDERRNAPYLLQGVTTVLNGNDGGGPVDVATQLATMDRQGIGTNTALYVGFGSVRRRVLGASSAAPTADQLARMEAMVDSAMQGGAIGLSTGLYYAPQSFATTEEVIALARVAARHRGVYDSHLRDEGSYSIGVVGAVQEAIRIGREGGLPVHIAHLKALGVDVWGRSDSIIAVITAARAAGQRVTADQYPYLASGSSVGASLVPRWAEAGGRDSLRMRAADPSIRARLLAEMRDNLRRRNGAAALLISDAGRADLAGKTLEQLANARGVEPVVAALDIVLTGDASVASFNMQEKDVVAIMQQPFVFTGSDGSDGHPRKYGTYPRKLREYVLQRRILPLESFVARSTSAVADALGIADRGRIAVGAFADLAIFRPDAVTDRSTYEAPTALATGMQWVLVNGQLAIDEGRVTNAMAGRALRRDSRRARP
jgi:N-acyl-D-amino-acid deacylase